MTTTTAPSTYKRNIDALCGIFADGVKETDTGAVGIELEQHIVRVQREDGTPIDNPLEYQPVPYDAPYGSRWILSQMEHNAEGSFPEAVCTPEGALLGAARNGAALSLEPAAQLELSAGPYSRLADALNEYNGYEEELRHLLEPHGERALPLGYHPSARATDLELIPKQRYAFMNRYLSAVSPYGPCMMRGSASTQVSIDYTSEADFARKMRLANFCVPLFSLITDNAPFFEGRPRDIQLVRTRIWRYLDPARSGIVPGSAAPGFTWEAYARWILGVPAIVAPGSGEGTDVHVTPAEQWHYDERPFGEIYADEPMTSADAEHALSMVFPDVRLKHYVEIRPADSLPPDYAVAYAALVKGLLCKPAGLDALETLLDGASPEDIEKAKTALMAQGYYAHVYGLPAGTLAENLVRIAQNTLDDEAAFLEPLARLVEQRKTPAEAHVTV